MIFAHPECRNAVTQGGRTRPEHPAGAPPRWACPRIQLALRWTAQGSPLRNDLMIFMQSFATERVDRAVSA